MTTDPLSTLMSELEIASRIFADHSPVFGSAEAAAAACKYFGALGIRPKLLVPLYSIVAIAADSNKTDAKKRLAESLNLALGAAAIDVLMNGRRNDALKMVAGVIVKALGGSVDANQLIEFRKNLRRRGGRTRQEARDYYSRMIIRLRDLQDLPQQVKEHAVLKAIREVTTSSAKG